MNDLPNLRQRRMEPKSTAFYRDQEIYEGQQFAVSNRIENSNSETVNP
jgi:hypothetical protein